MPITVYATRPVDAARLAGHTARRRTRFPLTVRVGRVDLTINSMKSSDVPAHLAGLAGFVDQSCAVVDHGFLDTVRNVEQVLGFVFADDEPEDQVWDLAMTLVAGRRRALWDGSAQSRGSVRCRP